MFVELNVAESLQQLHVLHYSFSLQGIITFQQSSLPNVDSTCPTVLKRTADTEGLQNKNNSDVEVLLFHCKTAVRRNIQLSRGVSHIFSPLFISIRGDEILKNVS